jgi:hypothetical protein
MTMNHGLTTPYYSTTMVALVAGADHYYEHVKQYVANVRGVTMTPQDDEKDDLDRIREVNVLRSPQDGPNIPLVSGQEADLKIDRSLLPYVVFSPSLSETILKNVVPDTKFEAWYTGTDGKRYLIKTRAMASHMRAKIYVTNWAQAILISEYLLAATPNTMEYTYPLFNLPMASPDTMETPAQMILTSPVTRRVYKRATDGPLYVVTQDVVLNFTIAVLPPGHQNDNGTSADGTGKLLPLVSRFNLDIWKGLLQEPGAPHWVSGAAITDAITLFPPTPTSHDVVIP